MRTATAIGPMSLLALPFALLPATAFAQDAEPAIASDTEIEEVSGWSRDYLPDWTLRFEPAAYFAAPSGDLTMPGLTPNTTEIELETFDVDSPVFGPMGEIHLAKDRWRVSFSGFSIESEGEGRADFTGSLGRMPVFAGETVGIDWSYQAFEAMVSYRLWDYADGRSSRPGVYQVRFAIDGILGARIQRFDIESRVAPTSAARALLASAAALSTDVDEVFAEPIAGVRLDVDLSRRFQFDVELTAGGIEIDDRSTFTFDVDAGFAIRFTDHVAALLGFRILVSNVEEGSGADEFEFNGSTSGLYWGIQVSF